MLSKNIKNKYESMRRKGISEQIIETTQKLENNIDKENIEKNTKMLKFNIPEYAINYQTEFDNHKNKNKEIIDKLKKYNIII